MAKHSAPKPTWYKQGKLWIALVAVLALGVPAAAAAIDDTPQTWQERLSAEGSTIDAQISGLTSQLDQLTADRDQLLLSNQDLTAQLDDLNSQLATITAERDSLQAQLDQLQPPSPSPSASPSPSPSSSSSTPPASMPVGSSLYSGGAETSQQAFQRRCTNWGVCPELVRFFYPGLPSGAWPDFGNATELVSFKVPSIPGFAAGQNDQQVLDWLRTITNDGTTHYVTIWHEPEDDVAAGHFTAAQWRDAIVHLQQLADTFDGTGKRIRVGVVLMTWTLQTQSGRNVANYEVPGMDFMGWDAYPGITQLDITDKLQLGAAECDDQQVPKCFLTEIAPHSSTNATQAQKAAFITTSTQVARDLGYDGFFYFDSTVGGDFTLTQKVAFDAIAAEIRK